MLIMFMNEFTVITGNTVNEIMGHAIHQGYFEDNQDFVNRVDCFDFYKLPDTTLKVTGKILDPVFTIRE